MTDHDLGLRHFLAVFWRQRWVIVVVTAVVVGLAGLWSATRTPTYSATATVLVDLRTITGQSFGGGPAAAAIASEQALNTEIEVLTGDDVEAAVEEQLGEEVEVTGRPAAGEVFTVSVTTDDPELAAEAANAYATTYLEVRGADLSGRARGLTQVTRERLRDVERDIEGVEGDLQDLAAELALDRTNPVRAQDQSRLLARLNALNAEHNLLSGQLVTQRGQAQDVRDSIGRISEEATVPDSPTSPKLARDLVLGLVAGLLVATGVALVRHLTDNRIRTRQQVEALLPDVPVMAVLPRFRRRDLRSSQEVVVEAHRSLRAALDHARANDRFTVLAVAGANLGDGATSVVTNLSLAMGQSGDRVVAVDADLRGGELHRTLGVHPAPGLGDLAGVEALPAALQASAVGPEVHVLAAGPPQAQTARLLTAPRLLPLFTAMAEDADLVLVDAPAVLEVSDAETLAGLVDAVLLVVAAGSSSADVAEAAAALERAGGRIVGVVLNRGRPGDRSATTRPRAVPPAPAAPVPDVADHRRDSVTAPA